MSYSLPHPSTVFLVIKLHLFVQIKLLVRYLFNYLVLIIVGLLFLNLFLFILGGYLILYVLTYHYL